ncbi:glucose/galactose MFS transporter [Lacimicrobium alkaliphilum]|uniref:Glucose/galactose MFS transporter n=2 Tax=Lacimicrobium alkaliphilum TaxID=1526571 RepID=A0ABQ1RK68_9ALTE|nr:glucose/galactose MFS transporter [Lacimicrobium alkaliphilum]
MFGFVTWLNGSLIPFLQITCELNHMQAYFVTLVFYIAYTVMALPSARVLVRIGYKNGMVAGLGVMTLGALCFIPAAMSGLFSVFLVALFMLGTGLTILQTAANPYIVAIGPRESAAVRISLMGILNKSAGVLAPLIFTALVFSDMSQYSDEYLASLSDIEYQAALRTLSERLITPYLIMALMLAALSLFMYCSPLPDIDLADDTAAKETQACDKKSLLAFPQLVLGVFTLFFYIGVEVIAGDTIGVYGKDLGLSNFAHLTSYTMAFMVLAYILGMAVIPRWLSQERALEISAVLGLTFVFAIVISSQENAYLWVTFFSWTGVTAIPNTVLFVALLGFSNALVWPAVWPMALKGLGSRTAEGSALLIMGISGGALLPVAYGALVEATHNPQISYLMLLPCYGFILYYARWGHKKASW